jgi:hypothetical protein
MIESEFGDNAQNRAQELKRQLEEINRQIANIIDVIKTSGRLSEAMNQAFADLETQRDAARRNLGEAENRIQRRIGPETLSEKIMAYFGDLDRIWHDGLSIEERKDLLRCYVHQVNINHSPTTVQAEIWLYKVPIPQKQMTLEGVDLSPIISRVNCGGRNLTLEMVDGGDTSCFLTRRVTPLKRPYLHYRCRAG